MAAPGSVPGRLLFGVRSRVNRVKPRDRPWWRSCTVASRLSRPLRQFKNAITLRQGLAFACMVRLKFLVSSELPIGRERAEARVNQQTTKGNRFRHEGRHRNADARRQCHH